ncbi:MAG: holo-[acyl-carrier-protein] synthase [Bacteroidetes bacterium]|nr:MAG: holo-[acyl-carrier-protein] synthase [Bacteroidota bacterium]
MIFGIGTDIIEVERIRNVMERDIGFRDKIFTPQEIDYCESKKFKYQHYAARFSVKESFMKAIGTGWRFGIRFGDIEVTHDLLGKPGINVFGKAKEWCEKEAVSNIHVSLSHLKEMATAVVVVETKDEGRRTISE